MRNSLASNEPSVAIIFDRWPTMPDLDAVTPITEIRAHYRHHIAELNADSRYQHIDVAWLQPVYSETCIGWTCPRWPARSFLSSTCTPRTKCASLSPAEAASILHLEPEIVAVVCDGGDLLLLPSCIRHWCDMGVHPDFVAILFLEGTRRLRRAQRGSADPRCA
ncbi:hypothetical protein, partial [Mycobacterium leprae]|uniref:hypothetical protein n=1 Tax=Mycobacterium leprae TaxID=1769 RepID=UPI001E59CB81